MGFLWVLDIDSNFSNISIQFDYLGGKISVLMILSPKNNQIEIEIFLKLLYIRLKHVYILNSQKPHWCYPYYLRLVYKQSERNNQHGKKSISGIFILYFPAAGLWGVVWSAILNSVAQGSHFGIL